MVRLTDHPDMTLDVYRGRKTTIQRHLCCQLKHYTSLFSISQVVFSYLWEQIVPFTREFESVKTALNQIEDYSKTCLEPVLTGLSSLVIDEWGIVTPTQVCHCHC